MEDSCAHLQRGSVQSVSGTVDDTYEQVQLTVQPTGKRQMQYATSTTIKVLLGLLGVGVLVAVVVAVVAVVLNQQQHSELKEKISSLEQMVHELQAEQTTSPSIDLPMSSVPTALPSTTEPTASSPATNMSPTGTSCAAVHSSRPSAPSGVYTIYIGGSVQGREVWCDMVTDGGGWTMFQRRQDGSVRFNRTWSEYRTGFGSANAEFWLGNDDLHTLTATQPSELRIDLWDWSGNHRYATYSNFSVDSEAQKYTLHVTGYDGDAGDSLSGEHNSQAFTTIDRDNDVWVRNCATSEGGGGGWWYSNCVNSNLNGRYYPGFMTRRADGVFWWHLRSSGTSCKSVSMMTRPR